MRLPDLLVIGAMKGGTTALHDYLAAHPQVFMSKPKELQYFVAERNWERGLDWYASHFEQAGDALCAGESSPHYSRATQFPGVPERIAAVLPHVRLVYLVRDPVERIRSAYLHRVSKGRESRPIADAVACDEPYVNDSRYAWQLEQFRAHVDRKRILVIESERLREHRAAALAEVLRFLGVDDDTGLCGALADVHTTAEKRAIHPLVASLAHTGRPLKPYLPARWKKALARAGAPPLDPARSELTGDLAADLRARLADDVRQLRSWLGPDFHGWGIA